jgi:hypothetical protein
LNSECFLLEFLHEYASRPCQDSMCAWVYEMSDVMSPPLLERSLMTAAEEASMVTPVELMLT